MGNIATEMRRFPRLPAASPRRPAASARQLIAAGLCAIVACGCGLRPAQAGPAGGGTGDGNAPRVDLSITITGDAGTQHRVLRCNPDGGSYADPAAACRALLAVRQPFAPLPKGIMCPMIMAGDRTATITGRFNGTRVHATWPDGGCYLGRWDKLKVVFN